MYFERFEDIIAWKKAKQMTLLIYKCLNGHRDFGYKDQIQRASLSIMNNIAEGFERMSDKEFVKFLYISKGSCGGVRSMLILGRDLGYLSQEKADLLIGLSLETSRMIMGLIKAIYNSRKS